MNKRINKLIDKWWNEMRQNLQTQVKSSPDITGDSIMHNLWQLPPLQLKESDYQKRQRAKNVVPLYERCIAKRANGEQCTRRRREGATFCGTHAKGTPHGTINMDSVETPLQKVNVWLEEIAGISYYIDDKGNVYNPQDVYQNKINPRKIHKYEKKDDGTYHIIS